jgi:DMSO/TMAO reductase YedYZ molybdopterin-dependent catalytic subunit
MVHSLTRRQFLRGLHGYQRASARVFTPTYEFFRQHIGRVPNVDPAIWSLTIGGMVSTAQVLAYDDLLALPAVEIPYTLACIGNPPGGARIGTAIWRGAALTGFFERVGLSEQAAYARVYGLDGYAVSLSMERLQKAFIAYEMNGGALPIEHGFPARLVVPGLYGYKMPKWLDRIVFTESSAGNVWEAHGWSRDGIVQTTSTIVSPQHLASVRGVVSLSGIAYAGERAITAVEMSIEGGDWMPVSFEQPYRYAWAHWQIDWTPPAPGDYQIRVRATDSMGFTQSDGIPIFPSGSSATHAILVRVQG